MKLTLAERIAASYHCLKDPLTPTRVKVALLASVLYFFSPLDLIPDFILILGQLDDLGIVTASILYLQKHIKPEHILEARK